LFSSLLSLALALALPSPPLSALLFYSHGGAVRRSFNWSRGRMNKNEGGRELPALFHAPVGSPVTCNYFSTT
jgi:hypothetical protein